MSDTPQFPPASEPPRMAPGAPPSPGTQTPGNQATGGMGTDDTLGYVPVTGSQPVAPPRESDEPDRTRDMAKGEAASVASDAKAGGKQVAGTAKQQAGDVAAETKQQAKDVYLQAKREFGDQAATQHQRAATGLSGLAGELRTMADRSDGGVATDLTQQAASRLDSAATWLGDREPGDVLNEVKRFARQRPGAFLAAAAAIGFLGGRLTRGLADDARDDSGDQGDLAAGRPIADPYATTDPTGRPAHAIDGLGDLHTTGRDAREADIDPVTGDRRDPLYGDQRDPLSGERRDPLYGEGPR